MLSGRTDLRTALRTEWRAEWMRGPRVGDGAKVKLRGRDRGRKILSDVSR
jgi:hypothetical protein